VFKRLFDIVAAAAGLIALSPVFALVALLIKLDSPGPVFYRQVRVGRHGQLFRIFKFRTMTVQQAAGAAEITVAGDARITRVGQKLRRYKIDELAQLIDVLRGTMSLVGPRPEVPRYVEQYPPEWRERVLSVRPGITDFASVHYRDENDLLARAEDPEREYVEVIMPSKLRYALHYVDNLTMADDLKVLGLTLRTVFVPSFPGSRRLAAMNNSKIWPWLDQAMSALQPRRRTIELFADGFIVLLAWHFTYLFRLGFERYQPGRPWYDDLVSFGVVAAYLMSLGLFGVARGLWRYFGFDDFKRITLACLMAGLISAVAVLMAGLVGVARAVLLLHPFFCIMALSMARMVYRMIWENARAKANGQLGEPRRAIVLGAGEAARRLVAGIHLRDGWTVVAMLDDDPAKRGRRIGGIPVLGPLADLALPHIHAEATHVIVAMPSADPAQRTQIVALARQIGLEVLVVPSQEELRTEA
jgi:lipopolysaccharide/colanic/teichoic acid biosynthesis glycosyltransferase